MKYLLDTNACIRYLNGRSELLRERIDGTGDEQIVVCSIVEVAEERGSSRAAAETVFVAKLFKRLSNGQGPPADTSLL